MFPSDPTSSVVASLFKYPGPPALVRSADSSSGLGALLLGAAAVEAELSVLREHHVTHILQVGFDLSPSHLGQGLEYKRIVIHDGETRDLRRHFAECLQFIADGRSTGGAVLVHCLAGVSRSATIVVAYLMHVERLTMREALLSVRSVRPQIMPNAGFLMQLADFEAAGSDPAAPHQPWDKTTFVLRMREEQAAAVAAYAAGRSGRGGGGGIGSSLTLGTCVTPAAAAATATAAADVAGHTQGLAS